MARHRDETWAQTMRSTAVTWSKMASTSSMGRSLIERPVPVLATPPTAAIASFLSLRKYFLDALFCRVVVGGNPLHRLFKHQAVARHRHAIRLPSFLGQCPQCMFEPMTQFRFRCPGRVTKTGAQTAQSWPRRWLNGISRGGAAQRGTTCAARFLYFVPHQ
ncbi:hypothetical protein TW95_gp0765 [Pandoravirus inopinatum]|uniref:Uncharacterized protein n=1 Tax=Pandoravirus inopinatum TaxID=1605721 RepID=A0A0B5J1T0_9VIRU|nr:hypothetical protein TW95_gp0765 [Pandoravirus inopinatum]AJF97499.1 hypothetical protein [Pandoravirus inopinatum]